MPSISVTEPTGLYLTFKEREEITVRRSKDTLVRQIARVLGRDPGTISHELRMNAATRGGKQEYRAPVAQWKAQQPARRPIIAAVVAHDLLGVYVQEGLDGPVTHPDGTIASGPQVAGWKGGNKPHRQDRRSVPAWSPEQISHRLLIDFPAEQSMRISLRE